MMSPNNRKTAGTTLVEILVVIVVFLVGILAVAQIFPKGFQILNMNRNASQATFLARGIMEELKAHPSSLPDAILPVDASTGLPDSNFPSDISGFTGTAISSTGAATASDSSTTDAAGNPLNWEQLAAFNNVRRIVGEGQPIPAPKLVGNSSNAGGYYGGLVVLQYGPLAPFKDPTTGAPTYFTAYANDLTKNLGAPDPNVSRADYQFYVIDTPNSVQTVDLPSGPEPNGRLFQLTFAGYVNQPSGLVKQSFTYTVLVPAGTPSSNNGNYPLVPILLSGTGSPLAPPYLPSNPIQSVDYDSIRVQRVFRQIAANASFDGNDAFEVKAINQQLGILLFNPAGYNYLIARPEGPRQSLMAKVTYNVMDWRILHDDFRIDSDGPGIHSLPLQSLRTASQPNVDGTPGTLGFPFETSTTDTNGVDHFILIDLLTGGTYFESGLLSVDKSRGTVKFGSATGNILLGDGTTLSNVTLSGRPVRALFQSRNETAVQVLKASSVYSMSLGVPTAGQYYLGSYNPAVGGSLTRIYFPVCDVNRKVSVGKLWYRDTSNNLQSLTGQDFLIHPASGLPALPYIDITDAVQANGIDWSTYGYAVRDVKGSSVVVRVMWNPDSFALTNTNTTNLQNENNWAHSWRRSATETFLDNGVTSR